MNAFLHAQQLTKHYPGSIALDHVDFTANAGESIAIIGPSGSGKTTLLHCLAGILRPDAGAITLNTPSSPLRLDTLGDAALSRLRREEFGFVFQQGMLLPELPAIENVALPAMLLGTSRRDATELAGRWLVSMGLAGMEGRRPGELSGGQAQRVAVARALITGPAVVFADEPTGALDQATGHDVMRILTETTKAAGASLVVVTHDAQVADWCDRRIEVRDGLVVGATAEVPR